MKYIVYNMQTMQIIRYTNNWEEQKTLNSNEDIVLVETWESWKTII